MALQKKIRKILWKILGSPAEHPDLRKRMGREYATLIEKAARLAACELVEGDYLEFGVFRGASFTSAYEAMKTAFETRIAHEEGGASSEQQAKRKEIWEKMSFFAFDSFEGLPELKGVDKLTDDFAEGQYAVGESEFLERVTRRGVPRDRIKTVPGWFKDTVNEGTFEKMNLRKASVIWIDGDLYESARDVLQGIGPLLQDGTIIIFDDWFAFKGHPHLGEQKAFAEWAPTMEGFIFSEFHKEGTWRNSFVVSEVKPRGSLN